jgi:hypothetical protein
MTGNKIELIFQSMFKAQAIPNIMRKINIGVKLSFEA